MAKRFTKVQENFVCEHCGKEVQGSGYTNHCPDCLYSKHVDVYPGDRAESCRGIMEPLSLELKEGVQRIVHRCVVCGIVRKNKVSTDDSFSALLALAKKHGDELR